MANKRNRNRSNKSKPISRKKRDHVITSNSTNTHSKNVDSDACVHQEHHQKVIKGESSSISSSRRNEGSVMSPRTKTLPSRFSCSPSCLKTNSSFSPMTKQELAKSRSHLRGVNLLRKNCIIISGLPKSKFPTTAEIEKFFSRYGKIVMVVENPKGIGMDCFGKKIRSVDGGGEENLIQSNDSSSPSWTMEDHVFLSYMSEKSANLAVRDINSGKILSAASADGHKTMNHVIRSRFVYSPYCDKFLKGEHCRDLHCVLMHEDVKSNRNMLSPTTSPLTPSGNSSSKSSVAKSFKESYQTPPTILTKERRDVVVGSHYSCETVKSTRSFLEVTTGVEWKKGIKQQEDFCDNRESAKENIQRQQHTNNIIDHRNNEMDIRELPILQREHCQNGIAHSCSSTDASDERTMLDDDLHDEDEKYDDDPYNKHNLLFQQLIATPDSTLTKSTISSKLTLNTNDQSMNGYHRDNGKSILGNNRSPIDLCAKELFVSLNLKDMTTENGTILEFPLNEYSPFQHGDVDGEDEDDDDADISSLQTVKMCTSPWDFQSPLQLEKDNFDTLFSNNLLHTSHMMQNNQHPYFGEDRSHLPIDKGRHNHTLLNQQYLEAPNSVLSTTGKSTNQNESSPKNYTGQPMRFPKSPLSTKSTGCYLAQQQQQQQQRQKEPIWVFPPPQNFPPMTNYRSFPQHYGRQNATYYPQQQQQLPRVNFPFPCPMINHLQPHNGSSCGSGGHPYGNQLNPNYFNHIGQSHNFWWNRM